MSIYFNDEENKIIALLNEKTAEQKIEILSQSSQSENDKISQQTMDKLILKIKCQSMEI